MAIFRWSGLGWLSFVVIFASFAVAAWIAEPLKRMLPAAGGRNPGEVLIFAVVVAARAPAHRLLGRVLDAVAKEGDHSAFGVDVEDVAYGQAILGLALALLVGWQSVGPWATVGLALAVLIAVLWVRGRLRRARLL